MTRERFTAQIARCFVGVARPETDFGRGVKIFEALDINLCDIRWGERPCAIGFVGCYAGSRTGAALIELPQDTYEFLMRVYHSLGKVEFDAYVGTHELDMTPIKTWFPMCT